MKEHRMKKTKVTCERDLREKLHVPNQWYWMIRTECSTVSGFPDTVVYLKRHPAPYFVELKYGALKINKYQKAFHIKTRLHLQECRAWGANCRENIFIVRFSPMSNDMLFLEQLNYDPVKEDLEVTQLLTIPFQGPASLAWLLDNANGSSQPKST